jgi:hypothetical protein
LNKKFETCGRKPDLPEESYENLSGFPVSGERFEIET